jgi:ribose-phosphate pyrophosphokinase
MIQAAKLASAKRITAVVPWYPYSRQDKKSRPREPITAKLVADFLEVAGVDRVLTMDLHAGQIQGFFTVPVDHMTALPLFAQYYRDKGLHGEKIVAVSPDPGRAKMARRFGQMLEADLAIMNKVRPEHDTAEVTEVIGDVQGKVAILSDDMIVTGGTLVAGAQALKEAGATDVYACATHGLFPGDPIDKLNRPDKIGSLSVSKLLAETIYNVFADDSVSAIFAGENQLF